MLLRFQSTNYRLVHKILALYVPLVHNSFVGGGDPPRWSNPLLVETCTTMKGFLALRQQWCGRGLPFVGGGRISWLNQSPARRIHWSAVRCEKAEVKGTPYSKITVGEYHIHNVTLCVHASVHREVSFVVGSYLCLLLVCVIRMCERGTSLLFH